MLVKYMIRNIEQNFYAFDSKWACDFSFFHIQTDSYGLTNPEVVRSEG